MILADVAGWVGAISGPAACIGLAGTAVGKWLNSRTPAVTANVDQLGQVVVTISARGKSVQISSVDVVLPGDTRGRRVRRAGCHVIGLSYGPLPADFRGELPGGVGGREIDLWVDLSTTPHGQTATLEQLAAGGRLFVRVQYGVGGARLTRLSYLADRTLVPQHSNLGLGPSE